jgi:amino acid transporter
LVKVCIALSAFGHLVAVVYTSSKVKQQIARQCVIPFFKFFGKEDSKFETPVGALILHWIFTVIWITVTPNTPDGYGFVIGIFMYGQLFVGVCMGVAYFFIRRTYEGRGSRKTPENVGSKTWEPIILKSNWFGYPVALLVIGINIMVLVESARGGGAPHRWIWPLIFFGILGGASIYWATIRLIARVSNKQSSLEIRILKNVRGGNTGTIDDQGALKQAKLEGNNRIVVYELHGRAAEFRDWIDKWSHKIYRLIAR